MGTFLILGILDSRSSLNLVMSVISVVSTHISSFLDFSIILGLLDYSRSSLNLVMSVISVVSTHIKTFRTTGRPTFNPVLNLRRCRPFSKWSGQVRSVRPSIIRSDPIRSISDPLILFERSFVRRDWIQSHPSLRTNKRL
jgi:hypothetical protein